MTPAVLALLPDWPAEAAYWRQLCAEGWADGYRLGWRDGYEHGARQLEAEWPVVVAPVVALRPDRAETVRRRWHLCCPRCRRSGHRSGCPGCEDRDRASFGAASPGDYGGEHG